MIYNYILKSKKDHKWYTGCTNDLRKRFKLHNSDKVPSTKGRGPFGLIYYEACINKEDAFAREKYLKSGPGKKYLKTRLKRFLSLTGLTVLLLFIQWNTVEAGTIINRPLAIGLTAGLVGHWTFDGKDLRVATGSAYDISGNGNHGKLTNGPKVAQGRIGQALNFDGVNDTVPLANLGVDTAASAKNTVSFWMYWNTGGGTGSFSMPFGFDNYDLSFHTSNLFGFNTGNSDILGISSIGLARRWVHVVAVFFNGTPSNTNNDLYIDGVRQTITQQTGTPVSRTIGSSANISGWSTNANFKFNGLIDDVRVYNRALSKDEIKRLYNLGGTFTVNKSQSTGTLKDGLVGHWTFDGKDLRVATGSAYDISGNGNHGKLTNGPKVAQGRIGQALDFDGVDDYVEVTDAASLEADLTDQVTISAWVYLRVYSSGGTNESGILFKWNSTSNDDNCYGLSVASSGSGRGNGEIIGWIEEDDNGYVLVDGGTSQIVPLNTWTHVALTSVGTVRRTYINSIPSSSVTKTLEDGAEEGTIDNCTRDATIGRLRDTDTAYSTNGLIDDVRVYNRALNKDEIKRLYNLGGTFTINKSQSTGTLKDGLVGHWTFDGKDLRVATGSAYDISGNGNHGKLTNGPKVAQGRIGQALNFDGVDDYVDAGSGSSLDLDSTNPRSFAVWVMVRSKVENANIIRLNLGNNLGLDPQGDQFYFFINTSCGGASLDIRTATLFSLNTWHHVTAVYDGKNLKIYLNGKDDTQTPTTATGASCTLASVNIGRSTTPVYFNGFIDDVRVYNRALSQDEIKRLYNLGGTFTINKSQSTGTLKDGLVGHWTFDGKDLRVATGSAYDISGNRNHGKLTNGPKVAQGRIGQALEFDGSNDSVQIVDSATLDAAGSFSVSAWFISRSCTGIDGIVDKRELGENDFKANYLLNLNSCTIQGVFSNAVGTAANIVSSNVPAMSRTWYHAVNTWDGTTHRLYVNAVQQTDVETPGYQPYTTGNQPVDIGSYKRQVGNYFDGLIDDVRVYNRALSTDEIKRLYNMGR